MREYLISLVVVCIMCAVAQSLCPDGSVSHGISFAMAVVILFVAVIPIPSLLQDARDAIEDIELPAADGYLGDEWLSSVSEEAIEVGIVKAVEAEFSLGGGVSADATLKGDRLLCVEIVLSGTSVLCDSKQMERYIEQNLGCSCEVILFGE